MAGKSYWYWQARQFFVFKVTGASPGIIQILDLAENYFKNNFAFQIFSICKKNPILNLGAN